MFYFILYLILINIVAVIITVIDKFNAIAHKRRISEKTLLSVAALGGSVAMFVTMLLIRHKTKHPKFMFGIPLIIIMQLLLAVFILERI